ncbi:MAG: YdeI/OmpD-associated family protein [Fulvivirga sp.]|nr:YdeI/OmpD-associated family protein [Fulvivirga sp.]
MSAGSLLKKLRHQPDDLTLIINRPEDVEFGDLHFDSGIGHNNYTFILAFVKSKSDIDIEVPTLIKVAEEGAIIWIAFPKKSGVIESNITRNYGWDILQAIGYQPVAQVSINNNWSALRIKPVEHDKSGQDVKTHTFQSQIKSNNKGGAWVKIPFDLQEAFGKKGLIKVKAKFDGYPYRGTIANMGDGPILILKKEIRQAIGKEAGDQVKVEIHEDTEKRTVDIPEALQELLSANNQIKAFYEQLSYTNQKEYANWISEAKKSSTREKRLAETKRRLQEGIKNPFVK